MFIGSHISVAGGYGKMGKEALSIGANTLAFFTRNPRGGKKKAVNIEDVSAFRMLAEKNGFGKLVAHAPYTLNPCSQTKKVREFARIAVSEDLEAMELLPGNYYNFHPGSHTGQGVETGIRLICELLNDILTPDQQTVVLLETMAGKGSEVGRNFEELAAIIDGIEEKSKIGVCMDSCHVSDAGYDIVNDLDGVLREFDRVIGLSYLKALHLNDSQNPIGSRKDRHAKIGEGYLGLDTFRKIVNHPDLRDLPMILETPNDLAGYASEISLLRSMVNKFIEKR
ncbi:MAG: deoxyribonuclease IV [Anaerovoracaceae bacterium]|jgi:deoxyribonuclease-4